ncbi:MAG: RIP metalloprotease RseP [Tissierellia bacterium]|nr:RIP metalloprotease RseP [Tissierellia bacterium]
MATLLGSIFVFLLVVVLHELGHFLVAKKVGIRVNEFSIGMGPGLYRRQGEETLYSLRALPIGGYVAMEGEEESSEDPRSFGNASVGQRMAVVLAGAGMNFVLAIVGFFLAFLIMGTPTTSLGQVQAGSPAAQAGLEVGDKILSINQVEMTSWEEIPLAIDQSSGQVDLVVLREGQEEQVQVATEDYEGRQIIGISPQKTRNIPLSLKNAFLMTGMVIFSIVELFKLIFSGDFSIDMLSGPVGVVQFIGQSTKNGLGDLLFTLGFISANLGLVNLLPIPALDGGKFVFLAIEGLRGKPVSEKLEVGLSMVGISLLFALMIYVTVFGDLARILG